jgi:ribosomal protein S18 acetylase RimI-like enzyme
VEIRRATAEDACELAALWEALELEASFSTYPGVPFDEQLLSDHVVLVADDCGRVIGTVYANLSSPHFGYVCGLYVAPASRHQGVGRELMAAIARVLVAGGRDHVVLSVDTPNEAARAFYKNLGFEDASRMLRLPTKALLRDEPPA